MLKKRSLNQLFCKRHLIEKQTPPRSFILLIGSNAGEMIEVSKNNDHLF